MQIQINTDKNISGHEVLAKSIEDILKNALNRFSDQITRIEVHLKDDNSAAKSGMMDKHCLLEVRPTGQQPITVSAQGQTVEQSAAGAAKKMVNLLETELGKRGQR